MEPESPRLTSRTRGVSIAVAIVFAIATSTLLAQIGTFDPSFEGELWGVRRELTPPGVPAGVAFSGGTMFVADSENQTLIAYNSSGQVVTINNAEWNFGDPLSPAFGLVPHQLAAVTVSVNGADRTALLVSDAQSNRVAAFRTTGQYLFTLRLQRPNPAPLLMLSIGQLAMAPGARFNLSTATNTLSLTGSFAAAWVEQEQTGHVNSGALVYQEATAGFAPAGAEFLATSSAVLNGTENNPVAPAPQYFFGVTFDQVGNLYALDAFTERLHVYSPALARLFTFGTPVSDGTTAEFYEPWGLLFWPDATGTGGRLFFNDTYNNRIRVFRPVDGDADGVVDALQFEYDITGFVTPAIELFAIALDAATGTIAVSDFALPRVVVLQKPRLAAFNIEVLDASDRVIDSVCTAASYQVRFSLTVPAGMADVTGVSPTLSIDGVPTIVVPTGAPNPATLSAGQVATYTYALTAPAAIGADLAVIAGASTGVTTDILHSSRFIPLSDCGGETDPSTITATPSAPPQVSGWTPVFAGDTFSVTLAAQDDDGIQSIQYELSGVNQTGAAPIQTDFDGAVTDASVVVPFADAGRTTLRYRVRDGNAIWSPWQTLDVRTKLVVNRATNENTAVEFRVGDPEGGPYTYSVTGLPAGVTFSPATGQFAGVVSFDARDPYSTDPVLASGIYNVVVTETASGGATSNVGFTWTINHVNREPIISNPPVQNASIQQGQLFELKINGSDPDGDPVIFTMHGRSSGGLDLPQSITIDPVTGQISGIFPLDSDTDYDIVVGLAECPSEPTGVEPPCNRPAYGVNHLATLFGFALAVLDANLPPDILNPGPQTSAEGAVVTLPIQASDAEGDALTFAAAGLPGGLSIDAATGVIGGTVSYDAEGPYAVTVQVDDHVNAPPRSVTFAWTVTATNRPPVAEIPDRINLEGDTLPASASLGAFASDPDGSPVTFANATGLPPGIAMSSTGALAGALDFSAAGVYTVTVTVSDGAASTEDSFTWTVYNVNRAPTLTPVNQFNREGDIVSYLLPSGDPDGDALLFSINGLPPGLTLNESTGLISGTLPSGSAGTYTVNIGVADLVPEGSHSLLRTITWTVGLANRAPDVVNPGSQISNEGATIALQIVATDPDGDALAYSASGLPPGLSIGAAGQITGTLGYAAAGTYAVTVRATDPLGLNDAETFAWTINNVNTAPIARPDAETVMQLASVTIDVRANDSDAQGDALTVVSVSTPTSGQAVINADGTITFTATSATFLGPSTFAYTISDGAATATGEVTVTIIPNNSPPVCTAATGGEIWPPNHKRFYAAPISGVTDPDGNPITITVTGILQDEPVDSTGDGRFAPDGRIEGGRAWIRAERNGLGNNAPGNGRVYEILFTASDGKGGTCDGSVLWTVPHDRGQRATAIDDGAHYDSTVAVAGAVDKNQVHQKSARP